MAHSFRTCHNSVGGSLQIRSKPHRAAMALDYLGQRICCDRMAGCFGPVLMVRGEFRQLQQDLWLARRGHRLHDLDLDLDHRRSSRRQAQCGDGTSDGPPKHHRATKADRETRGKNGRHGWGSTGLRSAFDGMLTISEAQRRTELFLTGQMLEALHAVEY